MKHFALYLCLALALTITGCTKQQPDVLFPTEPQLAMIKEPGWASKNDYYQEFFYEGSNRLKEIKSHSSNSDIVTSAYSYPGTLAQYRYFLNGNEVVSNAINYKLNSLNLVQDQSSSFYGFIISYEYNEQKFIKRVSYLTKGRPDGYQVYSYRENNVLDSISMYSSDSIKAFVTTYTYVAGKRNTIGNENKGLKMLGKDQSTLVKLETRYIYNNPVAPGKRIKFFENEYDYTYDTKGRVKGSVTVRTDYAYPSNLSDYYVAGTYEYLYK